MIDESSQLAVSPETGEIIESDAERILSAIAQVAALIEESTGIAEAIALRDRAEAIEFLSRKIGLEMDIKNRATIAVINAKRRIGELTMELPKIESVSRLLPDFHNEKQGKLDQLADLGMDLNEVYRNETLAKLPDDKLNAFIDDKLASGFEITVGGVVKYAKNVLGHNGRKPKTNRAGNQDEAGEYDSCQTPPYALGPLLPYLNPHWTLWEPAAGERMLVDALHAGGCHNLVSGDILSGMNFFDYAPPAWDAQVTNPPYSIKYEWLERSYELGKPFALLLPIETLGAEAGQTLFKRFGLQVIFMSPRVDFKMPEAGWSGGGAQFPTAWFTWGLDLPSDMVFAEIGEAKDEFKRRLKAGMVTK